MYTGEKKFRETNYYYDSVSDNCMPHPWYLGYYHGEDMSKVVSVYLGRVVEYDCNDHTIIRRITWDDNYPLGREYIFEDSISALQGYKELLHQRRQAAYADSLNKDQRRKEDSVYKCLHTYQ